MFMLWGGGEPTLTHVDIDKAQNGGYGYFKGFSYSKFMFFDNHFARIQGVSFTIGDLAKFYKDGSRVNTSGWSWVISNDPRDVAKVDNHTIHVYAVNSMMTRNITLIFTKNNFSFRAKMYMEYRGQKFSWRITDTIIEENNKNLYDELYQNINWIL